MSLQIRTLKCLAFDGSSAIRRMAFILSFSFRFFGLLYMIGGPCPFASLPHKKVFSIS